MKRTIALLLVLASLLALTACGGSAPAETKAPEKAVSTEAPTAAPAAEPTLSPEEILYNSLPERMKQAVDVGIVELSQLEDLERIVTVEEASEMLQKAYVHRTGVESKTLNELIHTQEYASCVADCGWIFGIPAQVDMELVLGDDYENYQQWKNYLDSPNAEGLCWEFIGRNLTSCWMVGVDGENFFQHTLCAKDWEEFVGMMGEGNLYGPGNETLYIYALSAYDSTNGGKFFETKDGYIEPDRELTVADATQYALRLYNYPNPMEKPEFIAAEDVGTYNSEIITDALLKKEITLPAASCQQLPAQWHGVVMDDMQATTDGGESLFHLDNQIYEYEIQKVKEAGFNFIGLNLDFSYMQEYSLFDPTMRILNTVADTEDKGKFSVQKLEQLDQILAWCMEYDIHVNLRATALGDMDSRMNLYREMGAGNKHASRLAELWKAIARRYAQIPNEYLSFTLLTGDYAIVNSLVLPTVEAIREESPERCIIADICGWDMRAEPFAEMGVALSTRIFDIEKGADTIFKQGVYYKPTLNSEGQRVVQNFSWPLNGEFDAEAYMSEKRFGKMESCMELMQIAQEYGVGFMLSDFGVNFSDGGWAGYPRYRFPDDAYHAMITDFTSTMESHGYGWCFAHWYGPYGVAFSIPAIQSSTYEQVEDYPYYIDQGMMGLFQEINGVL